MSFSVTEATNVIKNGKGKMEAYKDKLSDADVKALVAYAKEITRPFFSACFSSAAVVKGAGRDSMLNLL